MGTELPVTSRRPDGREDASPAAAVHLPGLTASELRTWLVESGHKRFRADQILDWVYGKDAGLFEEMTNLSKALRAWLSERAAVLRAEVTRTAVASDGTHKLLLTWPDGHAVETVWIPDANRQTACLSSQVGCPVGCAFCASGLAGVQRNLTAGEIVEQALRVRKLIRDVTGDPRARLTNIVMMGMGEPLANYRNVIQALRIMNADWGLHIGARKITVSTVGLPRQIRQLADEDLQLNLALSLHAPEEELRRELIPWGKVPLRELLDACKTYFDRTGREITLEYTLLDGVNHSQKHASKLARIAKALRANVNLLRYNPVAGLKFKRPSAETTYEFQRHLRELGVNAHVRTSRGQDIDAACGQLRRTAQATE